MAGQHRVRLVWLVVLMPATIQTFAGYAQTQDDALRAAMDTLITQGFAAASGPLRWFVTIFVLITFVLFAAGEITSGTFIKRTLRALSVIFIILHSSWYITNVRNNAFDTFPNAVATAYNGGTLLSAAGQFDKASLASDNLVGQVREANTGWTASAFTNALAAWIADVGIQFTLSIECGIWLVGRKLMALVLVIGPWLTTFELFDRTRGWVDHFIGTIVSLSVFQLMSSALVKMQMTTVLSMLLAYHNAGGSVDQVVGGLFHVLGSLTTDAIALIALPTVCAIGSGVAASNAVASGMAMAFPGRAVRLASTMRGR